MASPYFVTYWAAREARMEELGFDPDDEDDWCRPDYETGGVDDE